MMLEDSPILIKEITTKKYTAKIEQHDNLYVVSYNDRSLPPVSNLTMALYLFEKLIDKEDKIIN